MGGRLEPVPTVDKDSFPKEEEKVIELWKKLDAFQTSLKQSKDRPKFTFYDGPPFATGLPHYGHILAGTIKDVVTRWAHQTGHHVERRFGWDTHGLPVEYEIDKTYNINGPEDVQKIGIKKYNELCRSIVTRYSKEWEEIISRMGRWIDFKNDYKTLYPWYMESIWWIFSQLYQKGLVYRGFKVMPFSTACSTPLSNFEAGQNYKDTQDPSVVVNFPMLNEKDVLLVAWTTTPWTLPSNLALCVNPEMDYVKVQGKTKERTGKYILMEARLCQLFKNETEYEVLSKFKGKELEGIRYEPLFDYFKKKEANGAFKVLCDGYVTSESGTGIVHQAPYFGEDDFRVCLGYNIISKDETPICPVDDAGRFVLPVTDFTGVHVKQADPDIIKLLRSRGRLVKAESVNHSYPFCWRSDTPLIYRAVPSWFIRVEQMQEKLLASNDKTYWVPSFVKDKRFANWLRDARDWAVSRNRYWGTPIPLWVSEDFQEIVCIGSIAELEKLSGEKIKDIHRDSIDHITIPSAKPGNPPLRRISEVFDCWFESGSMPYAQVHYPFENKREFEDCFPADFIAEGIDQTRGWFYTLLVISTALFGKPPFKNLICNGLVLAEDGQKMSKRKKNYPDPMDIVAKYGADSLRLYLTNSPSVRGENLRFKELDVLNLLKEVFIPWLNAYRFFVQQVERYEKEEGAQFQFEESAMGKSTNVMDRWILSFTQSLLAFVHKEMEAYHLYTVTPRLVKFVDNLTNWYVRFNRKRLKGETGKEDCLKALETLYSVLFCMVRVMAPFTPFITETMYQNLRRVLKPGTLGQGDTSSVHYLMVPQPMKKLICPEIETCVGILQNVVELGRYIRDKVNNPMKYPLPEVVVIHKDQQILDDVLRLEKYIKEELNVKAVTTSTDKQKYGVALRADMNFKLLGARLKGDVKKVQQKVAELTDLEIQEMLQAGSINILGHTIDASELNVKYSFSGEKAEELSSKYEAHADANVLILLDITPSQDMLDEGMAREVINRVQKLRKKANLVPTDEVTVWYEVKDGDLARIITSFTEYIETATKTPCKPLSEKNSTDVIIEEVADVKKTDLKLIITKGFCAGWTMTASSVESEGPAAQGGLSCPWVNIILDGTPRFANNSCSATLLLENPQNSPVVRSCKDILLEAQNIFGFPLKHAKLHIERKQIDLEKTSIKNLAGKTVVVTSAPNKVPVGTSAVKPYSRFVNVEGNGKKASVLLENPCGDGIMTVPTFVKFVMNVLGLRSKPRLFTDPEKKKELQLNGTSLTKLQGSTVYV
ncbi:isoleucine--tRNA ligase, cytoplasmic-like [Penaeus indicus]|uniref:isoleucine--tRNA ligase, cytoplasmic-like n=1 Tax=Penaeus indicus TaxID=29960 RepID=UPI00300D57D5